MCSCCSAASLPCSLAPCRAAGSRLHEWRRPAPAARCAAVQASADAPPPPPAVFWAPGQVGFRYPAKAFLPQRQISPLFHGAALPPQQGLSAYLPWMPMRSLLSFSAQTETTAAFWTVLHLRFSGRLLQVQRDCFLCRNRRMVGTHSRCGGSTVCQPVPCFSSHHRRSTQRSCTG